MTKPWKAIKVRGSLLLLLCCAFFAAKAEDRLASPGPERVIRDFYRWYVQEVVSHGDPLTKKRAEMKRFATARLLRAIDKMIKGPDGLDGDYFLDAQDFDEGWGKNIKVSAPVIKGERATVEVELQGAEAGTRKLRVSLAQESRTWKVDKVEGRH